MWREMIKLRAAQNRGEQENEMETEQGKFHARKQAALIMAKRDAFASKAASHNFASFPSARSNTATSPIQLVNQPLQAKSASTSIQQLPFQQQHLAQLGIIDILHRDGAINGEGGGSSGALAEDHEDGFHA